MRKKLCRWTVAAVTAGMALGVAAKGQSSEPACTVGVNSFSGGYSSFGRHFAYSATVKTTLEQKLPDGNTIRGFVRFHQAQDGAGRTFSEQPVGCQRGENGEPQLRKMVHVFDPATHTSTTWNVGGDNEDKVVRIYRQSSTPPKPLTPAELAARQKSSQAQRSPRGEVKREDLGTKTIAGVEAHGLRTTRTIPAGEEGNELPLVVTNEYWNSKEHGIMLLAISDDPRRGKTTYEIEELSQNEPNPSVFAPPEGYTVEDRTTVVTASTAQ
ncbi:hypothetical protein [Granulicella sp. S156]|jgi:hypothetical protein|uniref:hypothetical protein n=1 Tax=Granulicella sp. S156 TaxID=1747224 RepID=UPI00131BF843|nr:hypothetical protein [Granulicella sp. S156]